MSAPDIPDEIVSWAKRLPEWQGDAVRRLVVSGELSEDDERELFAMMLEEHGISDPERTAPKPQPLRRSDFSGSSSAGPVTVLEAIHSVKNVNALAPEQKITFSAKGVTVIYGKNASGKSGYARILKRACRTRGEYERVLPNVFLADGNTPPGQAIFDVIINEARSSVTWQEGDPPPECLADIQVFDSKCERVFVDQANKVEYIPYGLDVFRKLAALCDRFRILVTAQLEEVKRSIHMLEQPQDQETQVARLLSELTHETPEQRIEQLATLSAEELSRLEDLESTLQELDRVGPENIAIGLRSQRDYVIGLRNGIVRAEQALPQGDRLKNLSEKAGAASEAARLAREQAFQGEVVPGTGSDAWKEMFLAAKRYSEEAAYPEKPFPVTDPDARCLLCQQPVGADAAERLRRFNAFIMEETEHAAELATEALERAKREFEGVRLHVSSEDDTMLAQLRSIDEKLAEAMKKRYALLRRWKEAVKRACVDHRWDGVPKLDDGPAQRLANLAERLKQRAEEQASLADPERRSKLEKERAELRSRRWLSSRKAPVLREIELLQRQHGLQRCWSDLRTTEITKEGTELVDRVVTESLREALNQELRAIGVPVALELHKEGEKAETLHRLRFRQSQRVSVNLSQVLSEGEQRAIALASFLAELSIAQHGCGIVFDDPVRSLDHEWREKLARRLVEEGKKRQVVVFTHDIVFLVALQEQAEREGATIHTRTLERCEAATGIVDSDSKKSWDAMNVGERIEDLRRLRREAAAAHQADDGPTYREKVQVFYSRLRATWERTVEEILFNKVVHRFRASVQTNRLEGVVVEHSDYETVSSAMTKCSNWTEAHDTAIARDAPSPTPEELDRDIEKLDAFVKKVKARRKRATSGCESPT